MHDIRLIRDDPDGFDAALARRGLEPVSAQILALDAQHRALTTRVQEAQSRRNDASKAIGQAMGQGDKDTAERLKAEVTELKQSMPQLEEEGREVGAQLNGMLETIPNLPAGDVPQGGGEDDNVEVARWGEPRSFDFAAQEHADLGPPLGMDFETGAKISGARFTFLRGGMARLHRAIGQFMLDQQVNQNGYTECAPPVLVNDAAMYGTDKLPKFAEDSFQTSVNIDREEIFKRMQQFAEAMHPTAGLGAEANRKTQEAGLAAVREKLFAEEYTRRWLIPTSEVSLTSSVMGEIIDDLTDPIRLTALTPCFRSEAGAAGKDTRGFIRQHQFEKVELVSICRPEDSEAEHERMTECAEGVLQALELPYRKMLLCTGDMGFGARKTYDLEVWLPGQGTYREISSCSNTGDFQARRMNARYRPAKEDDGAKKTDFVHTLNGSGLAVGRTLVAVLENYQQADGSVTVPEALKLYMGGVDRLEPAH